MHDRRAKEVRLGEMMRDMRHVFPEPSAEAAEHVEQELRDNRRALGQALHLAASPSTLVTPPGPSPSVLAYAAAAVPLSSAVAPSPLGSALLFPAMRPSSRQQVAYLFQALNAMLEEVGQRKEIARRGAVQVMLTAAASKEGNRKRQVEKELKELIEGHQPEDVQVPNLMADMETYAAWCGLAHVNTAAAESTAATAASSDALSSSSSGHLSSPVAELAIGAFLHTPSKAPAPAASSATPPPSFLRSPAPAPPPKHQRQVSTIDARFESSLEQLVQLADHHNATTTSAQAKSHHSHTSLITVLQEISVYFAGIHEIARQEYQSCQERGDLLHLLVQRCATLTQSLLPLAQREVLHTVASFKSSIHSLMLAQEAAMQEERQRYQKAEIAAAQKMIAQREELKVRRERIETLERECERRKLECAESDRLAHANRELTAQLASLREQVASAEVWRETQRLTMEQLHFSTKDAREKQERAENEARELREQAGREKKKYERNLIHMQTRFLELRIPDAPPPASGTVVADPTGMDPSLHAELSTLLSEHDRLASESLAETLLDARGGMKKHPTGSGGSSSTVESPSRPGLVKLRSRMHGRTDLIYVGQDKGREEEEANGEEKRAVSEGEEEEAAEESDSRSTDDAQANRTTKTTEEESKESTAYPLAPTQAAKPSAASPAKSPHSTAPPSHLRASSLIVGQAPFNTTGGINEGAEEEGEEAEHAMGNDDDEEEDEKNTPEDDAEDADDETASIVTSSTKAFTTSSSSYAALHAALLAPLLKNTRLKYSPAEVTTYLLTRGARFYDMILTKKQKQKFRAIHATTYQSSSSATADPSTATPSTPSHSHSTKKLPTLKLPGQIGPKDWCVNFCWSLLRRKIEADQVADCYQQQRMPFPEWVYQLLLMHGECTCRSH
jgi:hypothetical protein